MSDVSIVFDADTGRYIANLQNMDKATAKAADAVALAKNKILAANKEQIEAAKKAGASTEDLERIQRKSATAMANVTEGSASKIIASLDRISAKNKQVAAELDNLGKVKGSSGHSEFNQRMATSASVRALEGNVGIRPVENIIASIPALSTAVIGIGTLVGIGGLAGLFAELGIKGVEAFEKVHNATTLTKRDFDDLHIRSQITVDDKAIENQKIQDQIDKLSGHPNNGLASALLEAKKMADQLVVSLQEDRKQLEALLKEHATGSIAAVLNGVASTGQQNKEILADQGKLTEQVENANDAYDAAVEKTKDPTKLKEALQARNSAVRASFQSQIDAYVKESARLKKVAADSQRDAEAAANSGDGSVGINAIDNGQQVANIEGRLRQLRRAQRVEMLDESIYTGQTKLGGLKQGKEEGEARTKAAEAQFKQMEARFAQLEANADGELSAAAKINFWERQSQAAGVYSENVAKVLEKIGPLTQEYYRQLGEAADKAAAQQRAAAKAVEEDDRRFQTIVKNSEERDERAAAMADKLTEARRNNANAMAEWTLQQELATGAITRHNAAAQIAARHEAEYAAKLNDIASRRSRLNARLDLDDEQKQTGNDELDVEKTNTEGARDRQSAADKVAIDQATVSGAVRQIIQEFEAQSKDVASYAARFTTSAIQSTNEQLTRLMTGQKTDFKGLGRGIATDAAGFGLKSAESKLLESFGIGTKKPTGSSSDPLYIKSVDLLSGDGMTGSVSSLGKKLFGGGDSDSDSGGGGFLGGIASVLKLPGFAAGGAIGANTLAMVGENGPELFMPRQSGSIVPNHALPMMGGFSPTVHVDARGSNDPAATEAAGYRGAMLAMQHAAPAIMKGYDDRRKRLPATKRF